MQIRASDKKKMKNENKKSMPKKLNSANDDLLREIVGRTDDFYNDYNEHIDRARNYLIFLYIDQWDPSERKRRTDDGKPALTFNKLTSIVRSSLGEARENSPSATIRGVGKNVTQDQVDLWDGLCRQIDYDSDADVVYQISLKAGMECGWGAARVVQEYENEGSFKKRLRVVAIQDFQTAFWDPLAQESDKSDGDYCGVYTIMSLDKFKKLYPEIKDPQSVIPEGINYFLPWNSRDAIIIAEIYYKEYKKTKLVQLSDGEAFEEDEAKEIIEKHAEMMRSIPHADLLGMEPLEIVNERDAHPYEIKHVQFIRNAILDQTDYPGKLLPIVYFEGDSTVIDGRRIPIPYVQDAIDAQKLANYVGSEMAYAMLRARKETVIGTPEMFAGYEDDWQTPDQVQGMLMYNEGTNGDKPQFVTPEPFSNTYNQVFQYLTQEIYNVLGWGEEARGMQSNAQSGTAIAQRKSASKKPVNVYVDNNARGIKSINKIKIDMIPHTYDTEQTIMIMGKDLKSRPADINQPAGFSMSQEGDIEDQVKNDMSKGQFAVEIRVDGCYDEQQIAAMNCFIQLAHTNPAIANLIPDLMAEVSGLENTQKLVERLKTLLPPDILAKEEGKPMPPPQPNPQAQLAQQQMQLEEKKLAQEDQKLQLQSKDQQLKAQQLAIDEQKIMQQSEIAGINHATSLAKADAEVQKIAGQKDIAVLTHATKIKEALNPRKGKN